MTFSAIIFTMALGLSAGRDTTRVPVRPVAEVDLARYTGLWHEVAKFPNRFQAACVAATTAEYTLLPDGQVRVVNSCQRADGTRMRAAGRAKRADADGPASRLKVRFAPAFLSFLPMVWGDYWILDLTADYQMALVGDPARDYLWILSRTPDPDPALYERMRASAAAQGFAVDRLVRSR